MSSNETTTTSGYLQLDDELTVYYETAGAGPICLLLVPGWTMSTAVFEKQLRHYADSTQVRLFTYDPRSQGRSSQTDGGHTPEQHGHDLALVIERLGLDDIVLVGWSNGGGDVLEYVRLYGTERLRGLVHLDSCPKVVSDNPAEDWVWLGRDILDPASDLRPWLYDLAADRQAFNRWFAQWMLEHPTDESVAFAVAICNTTPTPVASTLNSTWLYLDNTAELEALDGNLPVLYYVRAEVEERARRWVAKHTPAGLVEASGAHMMFWENPAPVNAALDRFIDRCSATM